jgi:hypothetical protein
VGHGGPPEPRGDTAGALSHHSDVRLPPAGDVQDAFRENGFVLVRRFLDEDESAELAVVAADVIRRSAVHIVRTSGTDTLDYRVVPGDVIRADASPIYALYASARLLQWVRAVTLSDPVSRSPHLRSAVNINCLDTSGQRYPWHTDAVPFTAVLFLTTLPESAGGEFLIRTAPDGLVTIRPVSGELLLMDGRRCAHAVAPLRENTRRVTIPMVFPDGPTERPQGLDDFLYSPAP